MLSYVKKVFVNLPELEEDKEEIGNRVANFHATLLIEKIRGLHINDTSKKEILELILKDVKTKLTFHIENSILFWYICW